jgi:hypothetical protein
LGVIEHTESLDNGDQQMRVRLPDDRLLQLLAQAKLSVDDVLPVAQAQRFHRVLEPFERPETQPTHGPVDPSLLEDEHGMLLPLDATTGSSS